MKYYEGVSKKISDIEDRIEMIKRALEEYRHIVTTGKSTLINPYRYDISKAIHELKEYI